MTPRKCAKCGTVGEFERLCPTCWLSEHPLLSRFKPIELELCARCGKMHLSHRWVKTEDLNSAFLRLVKKNSRPALGINIDEWDLALDLEKHTRNEGVNVEGEAEVTVSAHVPEVKRSLTDRYVIPISLSYTVCKHCSKAGTQYFEGVLQLRNVKEEVLKEISEDLKAKSAKGIHVTQMEDVRGGVDMYLTSGHFLQGYARELGQRYGGEVKINARIYSRDKLTSKEIYRMHALVRFPDFTAGDVVAIREKVVRITSLSGQRLKGFDFTSGKRVSEDYTEEEVEVLEPQESQVTKIHPHLEVLDPRNFQSVKVENKEVKMELEPGQKVDVIRSGGRLYLIHP